MNTDSGSEAIRQDGRIFQFTSYYFLLYLLHNFLVVIKTCQTGVIIFQNGVIIML